MRPLPKSGDRINCDPNRDEGDTPSRWRNPNRASATVLAVLDDGGNKVLVCKRWRPSPSGGGGWNYWVWPESWWHACTMWEIGPLPKEPRR